MSNIRKVNFFANEATRSSAGAWASVLVVEDVEAGWIWRHQMIDLIAGVKRSLGSKVDLSGIEVFAMAEAPCDFNPDAHPSFIKERVSVDAEENEVAVTFYFPPPQGELPRKMLKRDRRSIPVENFIRKS